MDVGPNADMKQEIISGKLEANFTGLRKRTMQPGPLKFKRLYEEIFFEVVSV
jgi:hypothetical protein